METWLTLTEAARYLKAKPRTLGLWVRQGKVKAYPLSGTIRHIWRFRIEDLDARLLAAPACCRSTLDVPPLASLVLPAISSPAVLAERKAK